MSWAQVITLGAAIIGSMWALFRWGLKGELDGIRKPLEAQLSAILEKVGRIDEHETAITEIKTAMKFNGCLDGRPRCRRTDSQGVE